MTQLLPIPSHVRTGNALDSLAAGHELTGQEVNTLLLAAFAIIESLHHDLLKATARIEELESKIKS